MVADQVLSSVELERVTLKIFHQNTHVKKHLVFFFAPTLESKQMGLKVKGERKHSGNFMFKKNKNLTLSSKQFLQTLSPMKNAWLY